MIAAIPPKLRVSMSPSLVLPEMSSARTFPASAISMRASIRSFFSSTSTSPPHFRHFNVLRLASKSAILALSTTLFSTWPQALHLSL